MTDYIIPRVNLAANDANFIIPHFNLTRKDCDEAEVVFVGDGPVALWTALNTKLHKWDTKIVILGKYANYRRKHVLKIDSGSLAIPKFESLAKQVDDAVQAEFCAFYQSFEAVVKDFKNKKVIPTQEIETKLKELALKAGIIVACDQRQIKPEGIAKPQDLPLYFPHAYAFIGAEGSHSKVRQEIFEDEVQRTALKHVIQIKYKVQGTGQRAHKWVAIGGKAAADDIVHEYVGRYNDQEQETPVTLQIFIEKDSFDRLKDVAKSGESIDLDKLRQLHAKTACKIEAWLKNKEKKYQEKLVPGSEEILVIPLEYYASQRVSLKKEGKWWFLAGDAAFGVPFFRALNNGLLCGSVLATTLANLVKRKQGDVHATEKDAFSKRLKTGEEYQAYFKKLVDWEIKIAQIKSFFISIYSFLIHLFSRSIVKANQWVGAE